MESSSGSALFLSLILTIDVMINLVFIVLCFFLYFLGTADALEWKCMDFWIILFALISIDCFLVCHYVLIHYSYCFDFSC
jgi:hypothetical protein